jgi:hypothetical protein
MGTMGTTGINMHRIADLDPSPDVPAAWVAMVVAGIAVMVLIVALVMVIGVVLRGKNKREYRNGHFSGVESTTT